MRKSRFTESQILAVLEAECAPLELGLMSLRLMWARQEVRERNAGEPERLEREIARLRSLLSGSRETNSAAPGAFSGPIATKRDKPPPKLVIRRPHDSSR